MASEERQGSPGTGQTDGAPDDADRQVMAGRWIAVALALAILAAGIWLVDGLERARKADDCLERSDRRCRQIQTPPR